MSIPGIPGIPGIAAVSRVAPTATVTARPRGVASEVEIDAVTQLPLPPRFPWLSRLSQALTHAAPQKPAFAPAQLLGDHIDRTV